jgi:hypothetical protein
MYRSGRIGVALCVFAAGCTAVIESPSALAGTVAPSCVVGTFASYITLSDNGCMLNQYGYPAVTGPSVLVSDFTYLVQTSGDPSAPAADQLLVTPDSDSLDDANGTGFRFLSQQALPTDADLKAGPGQDIVLTVDYTVSVVPGQSGDPLLTQFTSEVGAIGIGDPTGFVSVQNLLCLNGVFSGGLSCSGSITSNFMQLQPHVSRVLPAIELGSGITSAGVQTVLEVMGGSTGTVGIYTSDSDFSFDTPPPSVPEPASFYLIGLSVLLLILARAYPRSKPRGLPAS